MMGKKSVLLLLVAVLAFSVSALAGSSDSGKATISISEDSSVNGTALPAGQYRVQWETDGSQATLKFINRDNDVVATTSAKVTERQQKSPETAVLRIVEGSGEQVVKEIRLGGKKTAFVISGPSQEMGN